MPKYRKKPVVIEAVQYTGTNAWEIVMALSPDGPSCLEITEAAVTIPTLEGRMTVSVGDWVIRGVAGEFYPCKPDIFAATYEPA